MITIVSGLPRSGTSMLMQMLDAGGLPLLTDGLRTPDASNPRGYFEYEPVKRLRTDNTWLAEAEGRAVKVIAQLLNTLSADRQYRILFLERAMDEVMASQNKMLETLGRTLPSLDPAVLRQTFAQQVTRAKTWMAAQPNMDVYYLQHRALIETPVPQAEGIAAFLGGHLDAQAMAAAVDPTLYRQRPAPHA